MVPPLAVHTGPVPVRLSVPEVWVEESLLTAAGRVAVAGASSLPLMSV